MGPTRGSEVRERLGHPIRQVMFTHVILSFYPHPVSTPKHLEYFQDAMIRFYYNALVDMLIQYWQHHFIGNISVFISLYRHTITNLYVLSARVCRTYSEYSRRMVASYSKHLTIQVLPLVYTNNEHH